MPVFRPLKLLKSKRGVIVGKGQRKFRPPRKQAISAPEKRAEKSAMR